MTGSRCATPCWPRPGESVLRRRDPAPPGRIGRDLQRDDGRWVADSDLRAVGLPVSVREVIGGPASLGPDTEGVLGLAAVIGRDFDIALLASVAHSMRTRSSTVRRCGHRRRAGDD